MAAGATPHVQHPGGAGHEDETADQVHHRGGRLAVSILGRIGKIATGLYGAAEAPFGLVKDLATSPFTDDEVDGFLNTIYSSFKDRGGQLFGRALGPEEGVGALFGAVPEPIREPVAFVTEPVMEGLETVYREGISEPISAAITASSLADRPGGGGLAGLFDADNWREGYRIAQDRSPGQAFALAYGTKDIADEAEVNEFAATDTYEMLSGTADAVLRLKLDPTILAGKAGAAVRESRVIRVGETAGDLQRAVHSPQLARFNDALEGLNSAEIRHRFFPDHAHGAPISHFLADAADSDTRLLTAKALMGDTASLDALSIDRADLASQVNRALDVRRSVGYLDNPDGLFAEAAHPVMVQAEAELDALFDTAARQERLDKTVGMMREVPRDRVVDRARSRVTRSDFYQSSPYARPLRRVFTMQPHGIVNLHDTTGDVQLARMLEHSPLPIDRRDALRGEYMAATDPGERLSVLVRAEDEAVTALAKNAGMTVDEVDDVLRQANRSRGRAAEVLKGRKYDGENRSLLHFADDEDGVMHEIPLMVSQEVNLAPLADLDEVRRATTRIGQFRARHPSTDIPEEMLTAFYKVWRPSVLLRVGWPVRVVGDEQLRIIAKIGALAQMRELKTGLRNRLMDRIATVPKQVEAFANAEGLGAGYRAARQVGKEALAERVTTRGGMTIRNYEMQGAFGVPADNANIYKDLSSARASFMAIFGREEDGVLRELRERSGQWRSIGPDEPSYASAWEHAVNNQIGHDQLARKFLEGETVDDAVAWMTGTDEGLAYMNRVKARRSNPRAWASTLKEQVDSYLPDDNLKALALGRKAKAADLARLLPDPSVRPIVHGEILEQATGRSYVTQRLQQILDKGFEKLGAQPTDILSRQPFFDHMYRAEVERLVNVLDEQPGGLTLEHLSERRAVKDTLGFEGTQDDFAMLRQLAGRDDHNLRAYMRQNYGGDVGDLIQMVDGAPQPTRNLIDNYDQIRAALQRAKDEGAEFGEFLPEDYLAVLDRIRPRGGIPAGRLRRVEEQAREYALGETKTLLYDLAEQSDLARMLRFWMPFYGAWQEVITRWSGLAVENPAFIARARLVWNAPEKAGIVTDETGAVVHADGSATNALGERGKAGSERFITLPLPEWVTDIPGLKGVKDQGGVKFSKKAFNLALSGAPGFGPVVQIAANEIVKDRPELEASLKFVLPFGTTQDTKQLLMPAFAKRLSTRAAGEEDRVFRNTVLRLYFDSIVDYNLGKRDDRPTYAEAKRKADAFYNVRLAASWFLPAQPQFTSPYQAYIDAYRALKEKDPETADEQFLERFGPEFFPLTQSLSRSMDGVPPTLEGFAARKKYRDLIEQHPDLGGLIVGSEGAGEFARAVYDSQLASKVKPGGEFYQRESPSFEEASVAPDVRLGWIEYSRAMDLIEAARVQMGLPNLNVKAAAGLLSAKQQLTAALAQKHPDWYSEFSTRDELAFDKRLAGLRTIAADKRLSGRSEIQVLGKYLQARDAIQGVLARREHKSLTASDNADLRTAWDAITGSLIEQDLSFSQLFYRFLERDTLAPSRLPETAA